MFRKLLRTGGFHIKMMNTCMKKSAVFRFCLRKVNITKEFACFPVVTPRVTKVNHMFHDYSFDL